jgi:glycogen synthase
MPKDMEFMDIRKGSDVEFGQSIYEPFGIAQLEPLTFGGICVVSSVCGCAGFVLDIAGAEGAKNLVIADYTKLNSHSSTNIEDLLKIDESARYQIEHNVSEKVAMQICSRLAKSESETENMIKTGYSLAKNMSWDEVVKNYLLPCLQKVLDKPRSQVTCIKA